MLGMNRYPAWYIHSCRAQIDASVKVYRKQVGAPPSREFETHYFNNLILVVAFMFEHRLRTVEGKDGNPLNEVRVITNTLLYNNGIVRVAKLPDWPNSAVAGLKLPPERSVLGLKDGDVVQLDEPSFIALAKAFFEELEHKFT